MKIKIFNDRNKLRKQKNKTLEKSNLHKEHNNIIELP